MIMFGDMMIVDEPPAKLMKALAVIADQLHSSYDLQPNIKPRISRESCVLCSLTVRDFLRKIDIQASVHSVYVEMYAEREGRIVHSLGIGHPTDTRKIATRWNGHLVAMAEGWLIDTTLYQAQRSAWPLPGMIAVPVPIEDGKIDGRNLLSAIRHADPETDFSFDIGWFDNKENSSWRNGPDRRDRNRRLPVIERMVQRFGKWSEA